MLRGPLVRTALVANGLYSSTNEARGTMNTICDVRFGAPEAHGGWIHLAGQRDP